MDKNVDIREMLNIEIEELEKELVTVDVDVRFSRTEARSSTTSICKTRP